MLVSGDESDQLPIWLISFYIGFVRVNINEDGFMLWRFKYIWLCS